ncbi:MAG: hypothetical protein ACLSX5_01340 [Lachnospiraceae bacterium]
MRKKFTAGILAMSLALSISMTAWAGEWKSDANGWWWAEVDGSYPTNSWKWLDGNQDGTAECYFFGENGYMLTNSKTPDGYTVNANGAWVENGVIQTQSQNQNQEQTQNQSAAYADDYSGTYVYPGYHDADGNYYEPSTLIIAYDPAANAITVSNPDNGYSSVYTYFGAGLNGWTCFELVSAEEKDSIFFSAPGVMQAYGWETDFISIPRS